jgi:hypothetical protein
MVAGTNYKLTFQSHQGNVDIIVFDQPWTNTREILSIEPSKAAAK